MFKVSASEGVEFNAYRIAIDYYHRYGPSGRTEFMLMANRPSNYMVYRLAGIYAFHFAVNDMIAAANKA